MNDFGAYVKDLVLKYGPTVALALATLIVGFIVIGLLNRTVRKILEKRDVDPSLKPFLSGMFSMMMKTLLIVSVISMLGVEATSFVAILGAAGLAIGMALSGTLQNFAGGVMILLFKPYKVGDFIEAQGYSATVKEIQIFNTILKTGDNKIIIIANGKMSNSSIVNYSMEPQRRVDMVFGIGYGDDIDKAKEVILQVIQSSEYPLSDPSAEPFLVVSALADSSVNITVRVWTESGNYWPFFHYMQENVKKEFDKNGISIPFPQTDVHIHQN